MDFFKTVQSIIKEILINKLEEFKRPAVSDTQTRESLYHSRSYTKFLEIYVKSTRRNIAIKHFCKFIFFIVTLGALVAIIYLFYLSMDHSFKVFDKAETTSDITMEAILSTVSVMVPALASLIIAFLKIPQTIAEYLFNTNEDDSMKEVIKDIQMYDKEVTYKEDEIEKQLQSNKQSVAMDDEIEDVPEDIPEGNEQAN